MKVQKLKSFFKSTTKKCPSCQAELSKSAMRCPECSHNFVEKQPNIALRSVQVNPDWCCTGPVLLLILIVWLALKSEVVQTFLLALLVVLLALVVGIVFYFGNWFMRFKRMFRVQIR